MTHPDFSERRKEAKYYARHVTIAMGDAFPNTNSFMLTVHRRPGWRVSRPWWEHNPRERIEIAFFFDHDGNAKEKAIACARGARHSEATKAFPDGSSLEIQELLTAVEREYPIYEGDA